MKSRLSFLAVMCLCLSCLLVQSCTSQSSDEKAQELFDQLVEKQKATLALQEKIDTQKNEQASNASKDASNYLKHIIFFDIKDDVSDNQLDFVVGELEKLEKIESIAEMNIGTNEDVGDDRALQAGELIVEMQFKTMKDFYAYQKDQRHFTIRKSIASYLESKPQTYDYRLN